MELKGLIDWIKKLDERSDYDLKNSGIFVDKTDDIKDIMVWPPKKNNNLKSHLYIRSSDNKLKYFGYKADLIIDIPHFDLKTDIDNVEMRLRPLVKTVYLFNGQEVKKFVELPGSIKDPREVIFSIGIKESYGSRKIYADTVTRDDMDILSNAIDEIQKI